MFAFPLARHRFSPLLALLRSARSLPVVRHDLRLAIGNVECRMCCPRMSDRGPEHLRIVVHQASISRGTSLEFRVRTFAFMNSAYENIQTRVVDAGE